ncbi:MAG: mandelate racemase/muconate lactonizing enzyme family protein [Verrucomicrobiota bacterium]
MISPTRIVSVQETHLYYLPVQTRVPLKFGTETLTEVTCARVQLKVQNQNGDSAFGWGETPLSVQWVWPSSLPYQPRLARLQDFCVRLGKALASFEGTGHPIEISQDFQEHVLPKLLEQANAEAPLAEPMPWLAALVCFSAFDIALHDAYGVLLQVPSFETYTPEFLSRDLASLLDNDPKFQGKFPTDFMLPQRRDHMKAWHLVGGLDPLEASDTNEPRPNDEHPVLLREWIARDGLQCLKIKLRGNDAEWDYQRLLRIGQIGIETGVLWLSTDFNCTVHDPLYVAKILDRIRDEAPRISGMILYVEQPFPYELEHYPIEVLSVSARKPLFLDESAHDWKHVRMGRQLGWTGVALKTCKTLTGAILSACWAQAQGMTLMVQDLTNPMLAQIPHLSLAAYLPTIMGVETNSMQYYPEASAPEARVHPGIYQRRNGSVDLSSIQGPGIGYRLSEIQRDLPACAAAFKR